MDIFGTIAAIPATLKLMKDASIAVGQISSQAKIKKAVDRFQSELDLLAEILDNIQQREEKYPIDNSDNSRLATAIQDIQNEVSDLLRFVERIQGSHGCPGIWKRALIVLSGFETQLEVRSARLERSKSLLQFYLAESATQSYNWNQLQKLLQPTTSSFISKKLEGTAEWIWRHERFKLWVDPTINPTHDQLVDLNSTAHLDNRVLLIYGVKGCGKSVLAASVVERLKEQSKTTLFFSFWASHGQERRADAMLRTLLWQLLQSFSRKLQNTHTPRLLKNRERIKDLNYLIVEIQKLGQIHQSHIYCILDGIDESLDDWNDLNGGPLDALIRLLEYIPGLRLLLVGRQSSLRQALKRWPLHIEITRDLVYADLNKLIAFELDNCPNFMDELVRNRIKRELESKCTVMFLWIKLVFKELRLSFSSREIEKTLSRSPDRLDKEYCNLFLTLMTRLNGRPKNPSVGMTRARELLNLIVGSLRPLTAAELCLAYAFASPQDSPTTGYYENVINEDGIIDSCGDFVTTDEGLIYLGHTSIREFLTRPSDQWEDENRDIAYFRLEPENCHRILGMACLRYLKHVKWDHSGCIETVDSLMSQYPLLNYAVGHISSHFLQSDLHDEELGQIVEFSNSESFRNSMAFAIMLNENIEGQHPSLPIRFLEDSLQIWGILKGFNSFPAGDISLEALSKIQNMEQETYQTTVSGSSVSSASKEISDINRVQTRESSNKVVTRGTIVGDDLKRLQNSIQKMTGKGQPFCTRQLSRILPAVNSLSKLGAFTNPLDILIQAMERNIQAMSFLGLMVLGHFAEPSRPKHALRAFELAQARVHGKGDMQEFWAQIRLGACLQDHREFHDYEAAEKCFSRAMSILEVKTANPVMKSFWWLAARRQIDSLFSMNRKEEASMLASKLENELLQKSFTAPDESFLREWYCKMIVNSFSLEENRMFEIFELGSIYYREHLYENANGIMRPFTREASGIQHLKKKYQTFFRQVLAYTAEELGDISDALDILLKAKMNLESSKNSDKDLLCHVKMDLAIIYYLDGSYSEAERELVSVDKTSFWDDASVYFIKQAIFCIVGTYKMLEKTLDVFQVLHTHLPAMRTTLVKAGEAADTELCFVAASLLSHGLLTEAEEYIRKALSHIESDYSQEAERLNLHETLAFCIQFRTDGGNQSDLYDEYLTCVQLAETNFPSQRHIRLNIGFGMACIAAGKPEEATELFEKLVTDIQESTEFDDHDCAAKAYDILLFQALACHYKNEAKDAAAALREMISRAEDEITCENCMNEYDKDIFFAIGHMHLAEFHDGIAELQQGHECRQKALGKLEETFYEAFTSNVKPSEQKLDSWTSRWTRLCKSYILGRLDGKFGPEVSCPMYPFPVLWSPDHDGDFNLLKRFYC